jgi:hypothetical protein
MNYYVCNSAVIAPEFGDEQAGGGRACSAFFPGAGCDARHPALAVGARHPCATQQQPGCVTWTIRCSRMTAALTKRHRARPCSTNEQLGRSDTSLNVGVRGGVARAGEVCLIVVLARIPRRGRQRPGDQYYRRTVNVF